MFVTLNDNKKGLRGTILIFTEGTILKPRRFWLMFSFRNYVPIGNSVDKIRRWSDKGWNIVYLTSRKSPNEVGKIKSILETFGFCGSKLYYRGAGEEYKHIAESVVPAILVEDDCRGIGGERQMTITYVDPEIKVNIKSVVVPEFQGIDSLPDSAEALLRMPTRPAK